MHISCAVSQEDRQYMQHALDLAARGLGKTHPNPAVGCVILKDGKVRRSATGFPQTSRGQVNGADVIFLDKSERLSHGRAGGQVIGEGFHPEAGKPHAEVYALRGAGQAAAGATAYVTLEPCNHFGRTPPCSRALIAAGVKRVGSPLSGCRSQFLKT